MATRGERAKADAQRKGPGKKQARRAQAKKARASKGGAVHANERAAKKATVAREPRGLSGTATRKSTRASKNRMKATAPLEIREELQKTTPTAQYRKAAARRRRSP